LKISNITWCGLASSFLLPVLLAGCGQKNEFVEPPPPKVTVALPLQQDVTDYLEFTGTTQAAAEVEVRARVKGFLFSMHFTPGQMVEQGDLLFTIDPREYEANLNAAQAELDAARAELKRAKIELERAERLFKQQAGSESDVVKWRGEMEIARASILRAQAKVEDAVLSLSYTQVTAPIDGRVGRNLVDPGNLVGKSEATLLTTVTDNSPMYAYYNLNERDLLMSMDMYKERLRELDIKPEQSGLKEAHIPLLLGLANEEDYPHQGEVDFAESSVDSETGTLQLRGVFVNDQEPPALISGLFARLRMPTQDRKGALLVSARAIGADQGGEYLLVVNGENAVEKRPVVKRQLVDGLYVIEEGVRADDRVIVKGVQRARPGRKVDSELVEMSTLTTSAMLAEEAKAQMETNAQKAPGGSAAGEAGGQNAAPKVEKNNATKPAAAE
jgi:RND family efflux transporter MFP subunit